MRDLVRKSTGKTQYIINPKSIRLMLFTFIKVLIVVCYLNVISILSQCSPCYSIQNGNWSSTAVWSATSGGSSCNCVPSNTVDVIITTHTVDASNTVTVNNLTIESGKLRISNDKDIVVNGNLTLNNGSTIVGLSSSENFIQIHGGSTITLNGTGSRFDNVRGLLLYGPGTVSINGTGDFTNVRKIKFKGGNIDVINNLSGNFSILDLNFSNEGLSSGNSSFTNSSGSSMTLTGSIKNSADNNTFTNNGSVTVALSLANGNSSGDNFTITNTGTMTVLSSITVNSKTWTINNSGSFTHEGDYSTASNLTINNLDGGTWYSKASDHSGITLNSDDATNSFIYNGTGTQIIAIPSDAGYYNLTIDNTVTSAEMPGSVSIINDFIFNAGNLKFTANNAELTLEDGIDLTLEDGVTIDGNGANYTGTNLNLNGSSDKTITLNGTGNQITGLDNIVVNNAATTSFYGTGDVSVNGDFILNTSNVIITNGLGSISATNLTYNGSNSRFTTSSGKLLSIDNLEYQNSANIYTCNGTTTISNDLRGATTGTGFIYYNTGTTTVGNLINPNSPSSFSVSNYGTFTHSGNYANASNTTIENLNNGIWNSAADNHSGITFKCRYNNNTWIYNGASQDVFVPSDGSYYNLVIGGTSSKTTRGSITVQNNLTISNATLDVATNSSNLTIGGDYSNSGVFTSGSQSVTFNGSTTQTISGSSTSTFNNVIFNNTVTDSDGIVLNADINVNGTLDMDNTNGGDLLLNGQTIGLGTTGTITGESNDDRIYGASGSITAVADLSSMSTTYSNISGLGLEIITGTTQAPGSTQITRLHTEQNGNSSTSILRTYDMTPTNTGTLDATLKFTYFENELNGQTSDSDMSLFQSDDGGNFWIYLGGTYTSAKNDYVTASNLNNLDRVTVSNNRTSPLPVSLTYFKASNFDGEVTISWETKSEYNNDYFTLERSGNGVVWNELRKIPGAGNSNLPLNYNVLDKNPLFGESYYRLKQTDFNGDIEYFDPVKVRVESRFKIYPNPILNHSFTVYPSQFSEKGIQLVITDELGKQIDFQMIDNPSGLKVKLNEDIDKGVYFLKIYSETYTNTHKLFVH